MVASGGPDIYTHPLATPPRTPESMSDTSHLNEKRMSLEPSPLEVCAECGKTFSWHQKGSRACPHPSGDGFSYFMFKKFDLREPLDTVASDGTGVVLCETCSCSKDSHRDDGVCPDFAMGQFNGWLETKFLGPDYADLL